MEKQSLEDKQVSGPLRLRAEDKDSVQTVSALLQDALVPYVSMVYSPEEKSFFMQPMRFKWEEHHKKEDLPEGEQRIFSTVVFNSVLAVHKHNFAQTKALHTELNLLAIEVVSDKQLLISFSDEKTVLLTVEKIEIFLGDHDESWPTNYLPSHE